MAKPKSTRLPHGPVPIELVLAPDWCGGIPTVAPVLAFASLVGWALAHVVIPAQAGTHCVVIPSAVEESIKNVNARSEATWQSIVFIKAQRSFVLLGVLSFSTRIFRFWLRQL